MTELDVVNIMVSEFKKRGFTVATEIANFHRSADIAMIDKNDRIWIIECKLSNMSKAIEQLKTHKLSADKVFVGTICKKTHKKTINRLQEQDIGLINIMPNEEITINEENIDELCPWEPAKSILKNRILESSS